MSADHRHLYPHFRRGGRGRRARRQTAEYSLLARREGRWFAQSEMAGRCRRAGGPRARRGASYHCRQRQAPAAAGGGGPMSQAAKPDEGFVRGLNLFDATMIVVGVMIGSGVFIVAADMSRLVN